MPKASEATVVKSGNSNVICVTKLGWKPGDPLRISDPVIINLNKALVSKTAEVTCDGSNNWMDKFDVVYQNPNVSQIDIAVSENCKIDSFLLADNLNVQYPLEACVFNLGKKIICKLDDRKYNLNERVLFQVEVAGACASNFNSYFKNPHKDYRSLCCNFMTLEHAIEFNYNLLKRQIRKIEALPELDKNLLLFEFIENYRQVYDCFLRVYDAATNMKEASLKKYPKIRKICEERTALFEQVSAGILNKGQPVKLDTLLSTQKYDTKLDKPLIKGIHAADIYKLLSSTGELYDLLCSIGRLYQSYVRAAT